VNFLPQPTNYGLYCPAKKKKKKKEKKRKWKEVVLDSHLFFWDRQPISWAASPGADID
jgi:hypothetical protein